MAILVALEDLCIAVFLKFVLVVLVAVLLTLAQVSAERILWNCLVLRINYRHIRDIHK